VGIDTQTLYVLSTASLTGVAALIALASYSYPSALRTLGYVWAGATLLQGLGMAAIAARGLVPDAVSVIAAHGLSIAGFSAFHQALDRFAGGRLNLLMIYGPVPLAVASSAILLLSLPSYAARVAVYSGIAGVQFGLCGAASWRARRPDTPVTAPVAALAFGVGALLLLWRAALSATLPPGTSPNAIFRPAAHEQVIVLVLMVGLLLISFTFVMLCNERLNAQLRGLAVADPLTGHLNRRGLVERALSELSRARRRGSALGVALVDLDHLKAINDDGGHPLGDAALRHVARCLEHELRTPDSFGRWGGDEFLVLLPDADREGAVEACERVRRRVADNPVRSDNAERRCTVSIGLASDRRPELDFEDLVRAADRALFVAKQQGRDRVAAAPPDE